MYAVQAVKPGDQQAAVDFITGFIERSGADVLAKDNDGNTALHHAAQTGCLNLVKLILHKMVEKKPGVNPVETLNQQIIIRNQRVAGSVEKGSPVKIAQAQLAPPSTFKRNYCEVYAYLECVHVVEGQVIEPANIELNSKVDALMNH
jgi:ankyrin repeat protein